MKKLNYLLLAFVALLVISCGEDNKVKAPEINGFEKYKDEVTSMELQYPKGWVKATEPGSRFASYSSKEARIEFLNIGRTLSEEDVPGAKFDVMTIEKKDTVKMEDFINNHKIFDPAIYSAPQTVTIDGVPATKLTYSFDYKVTKYFGEMYVVTKDTKLVTVIYFEVIGDAYETLKPKFQEILKSFKVGVQPSKEKKVITKEADPPSSTFKAAKGNGFSIQIPDNFRMSGSGNSFTISGDRRGDCVVSISIQDAKGNSLDKILEQNAKLGSFSKTSLGGTPAGVANYKSKADLDSKIYFAVKDGKIYKVFSTYYKPEANNYKAAFTKMVNSIKFD